MQSMETIVNYFAKDMRAHGIPVRTIRKVRVNNSVNYYGRIRKTKFVKYPHLYQCECGSNDFTVDVLRS